MADINLVYPKVEATSTTKNFGRFVISPLEAGYGVTLGNALRRVLLSSLRGAAVTSVRISGVFHEFSEIPNVREDMTALILNLKQLRIALHGDESARLQVEIRGEGEVIAGDLECPPNVHIVNPDLHLLSGDSSKTELDLELMVEIGRGYAPAEEHNKLPIGEIPIDAIFTPVRKAIFKVERARVGHATDYDKLIISVDTDGTINPHDALRRASLLLVKHFSLVANIPDIDEPVREPDKESEDLRTYEVTIEELDLTVRAYNCLKRAGITKVGEILAKLRKGSDEILSIRNFGQKSLDELIDRLNEKGHLPEADLSLILGFQSNK